MKKEIVIASHQERITWLPQPWCPITTIYRCGDPTVLPTAKIAKSLRQRYRVNPHAHSHDSYEAIASTLETVRLLWEFLQEMQMTQGNAVDRSDPCERTIAPHAEKETSNCVHGREAEQWLNHIIWRYDTLADVTVFLQGHPHDHCADIVQQVERIECPDFQTIPAHNSGSISPNDHDLCGEFWDKIANEPLKTVCWAAGAQFAASRKTLRSQPRSWYQKIQETTRMTPRSGEICERLWWNIVGCPLIHLPK